MSGDGGSHWEEQLETIVRPAAGVTLGATFEMSLGSINQLFMVHGQPDLMLAHTKIWFLFSTDAGRNWAPVFLGQRDYLSEGYNGGIPIQSSVAQLAQPGNSYYLVEPHEGGGLYQSSTLDKNWSLINPSAGAVVSNGAGRLYAATDNFRVSSSDDGGRTWTRLGRLPASIFTLAIDPQYPDRIYAVTSLGLLISRDGGKAWYFLRERGEERWGNAKLALVPQDTLNMYLATGRQLWGTQDGGKSWVSIGRGLGEYAWFSDVAVDPAALSLVYAATPWGVYRWDKDAPITAVEEERHTVPASFALEQSYPNPFNGAATITYRLPQLVPVEFAIYNLVGQRARVLVDEQEQHPGTYILSWDGRDQAGQALANGVYFYRLKAGADQDTRRLLLLK